MWHPGVIGIVASRLVERYGRPTFLIGWDEGGSTGRGSGRSIAGFDLHAALHRVAPHLEKYGGRSTGGGPPPPRGGLVGACGGVLSGGGAGLLPHPPGRPEAG